MSGTSEHMWATATAPRDLIQHLRAALGPRAARPLAFFAIHLARLALPAMPDARSRWALDVAELRLLGLATAAQLNGAVSAAHAAWKEVRAGDRLRPPGISTDARAGPPGESDLYGSRVAYLAADLGFCGGLLSHTCDAIGCPHTGQGDDARGAVAADACRILREVAPDPARPPAFRPEWRTETAVLLARQMLAARDFTAMPILADALQDAGCDDEAVLAHCRDARHAHLPGCWALEAVLDRA
jgi:hypothetical protein